jgi:beta-alanine--pyruvate transaminase
MSVQSLSKTARFSAEQLDAFWMPRTVNSQFKDDPRMIVVADGRCIFAGLSGAWTCGARHNRLDIAEAVHKQLLEFDYEPPFQHGHP